MLTVIFNKTATMEICKIKDNQTTDLETIKMTIWGQQYSNERSHNAHLTVVLAQESQCHDALEDQRRLSLVE